MFEGFENIEVGQIVEKPFRLIGQDWMLITAGQGEDHKTFNTMTAAWGGLGTLWHKPVSFCFVRPSRYTFKFMEEQEFYTLSFFTKAHRQALNICGTLSGRDEDKVAKANLSPLELQSGAVSFKEARLILVCKKMYFQDLDPSHFLDSGIEKNYLQKDYHRMYVGEVTTAYKK